MTTATLRDLPESAYELGELKHDLRVSQEGFAISVLLLIVMSGLTIYAAWRLWPAAAAAPQLWDQARLAGLPVVLLCVVVFTAANASRFYLRRHTRVLLFEEGLVCFRKQAAFSCRWDEVDEINEVVNYRGEGDLVWHVTLRCGDFCWTFDNHEDPIGSFNVLAETIQEETSRRKLPAALAALPRRSTAEPSSLHRRELPKETRSCRGPTSIRWSTRTGRSTSRSAARGSAGPPLSVARCRTNTCCWLSPMR